MVASSSIIAPIVLLLLLGSTNYQTRVRAGKIVMFHPTMLVFKDFPPTNLEAHIRQSAVMAKLYQRQSEVEGFRGYYWISLNAPDARKPKIVRILKRDGDKVLVDSDKTASSIHEQYWDSYAAWKWTTASWREINEFYK